MLFSGFSCSKGYKGFGVLLWAPEESGLENGILLPITTESKIRKVYMIWDDLAKQDYEIDVWRMEQFKTEQEALNFQAEYEGFKNLYGICEVDGVPPVREKPSNSGQIKIITTPVLGQALKILGRGEEKVVISGMENYWYEVLVEYKGIDEKGEYTRMGAKGYCFGERLNIMDVQGNLKDSINKALNDTSNDNALNKILQNPWRPLYFQNMINQGRYDLDLFHPQIGFLCEPALNRVSIRTSRNKTDYEYTKILKINQGAYSFQDTDLRLNFISENRISVQYKIKDTQVSMVYIYIDDKYNIEELVAKEEKRRNNIFNLIYNRGNLLSSSAYGQIRLQEDWGFRWTGYEKLVPGAIPESASGSGQVDFKYHLSSRLAQKYDGIISFHFSNLKSGVNFLYKLSNEGIQLYFVDNDFISDLMIRREPTDHLVSFFFFGSEE